MRSIENREKFVPAEIKLNGENEFFVEQYEKNVKVRIIISFAESTPVTYKTQCFFGTDLTPIKYSESLSLIIGSTTKKNKKEQPVVPEIVITEAQSDPVSIFHSEVIIPLSNEDENHFEMN